MAHGHVDAGHDRKLTTVLGTVGVEDFYAILEHPRTGAWRCFAEVSTRVIPLAA